MAGSCTILEHLGNKQIALSTVLCIANTTSLSSKMRWGEMAEMAEMAEIAEMTASGIGAREQSPPSIVGHVDSTVW